MRKTSTLLIAFCLLATSAWAQPTFTNLSVMLASPSSSGGCMAVVDMNGDGLDDICKLDSSRHVYIEYQNTDGSFTLMDYGRISNSHQWGWAIGDIDNNGHKDVVAGGSYDGTHYLRISSPGIYTLQNTNGPNIFTQCMTLGDLDNNGRVDVFACHDDGAPNIWFTNGGGVPMNNNAYIDWSTACSGTAGDMSGNYGSTWTDFDNDGDLDLHISHCRQGVNDPNDCRRWDRLFVNDGANNFTDQAALYGMENREQTWTTDFGDYDNDGDMDAVSTTHSSTIMLFENDGTGHFTNVTTGSGLEITGFFLQGVFRDFDNDGFLDILIAGGIHRFFKGNGDGTFTMFTNLFPASKSMHSFAIGDLNNDGFEDVFASYGDGYVTPDYGFRDRLWLNTPNGNHWFNVNLVGTTSNRDAIGARTTVHGPWGVQIREVRAGESYGIVNSFTQHFGLGQFQLVDSLVIRWPSGLVETFYDLDADQTITVIEGTCVAPVAEIAASAPYYCTGGTPVTLTANAGYNYTWNTAGSTQSIDVTSGGNFTVTIDDGAGCFDVAGIFIVADPDETPTVTLTGDDLFCEGGSAILTSSAATSYTWSNAEVTQSITVTESGTYSVAVDGICGPASSASIIITVMDAPDAPTAPGVFLPAPGTADLVATGDSIVWYDVATGGSPLGYGNAWTTPLVSTTTSFWCEDITQYGGASLNGGKVDNSTGNGQYHNNNGFYLIFEAYQTFILRSVKVYANGAGNRDIAVVNMGNGTTVTSGTFSIPDGESRVQLDFNVPAGGPYGLRVTSGNPQLWRDGNGSNPAFPYALGTLGSITATNATGANALAFYYFFYDWEVEELSYFCTGPRTEVVVDVAVSMNDLSGNTGVTVWPNPTDGLLNVTFTGGRIDATLFDIAGRSVYGRTSDARTLSDGPLGLDLSGLAPGEYLLRARTADGQSVHRVVIR